MTANDNGEMHFRARWHDGRGALPTVGMTADDNGEMLFSELAGMTVVLFFQLSAQRK